MEGGKKTNSDITNSSNYEGNSNRMNVVVVTSKPRSQTAGNLITTHTWTSLMEKEDTKNQAKTFTDNLKNINITYSHQNLNNNTTILYEEEGDEVKPLAIYTQILRGASPIFKAKVMVFITVEQTNGSYITLPSLELKDDGYGDPDLVEGDGIYSRYLGHQKLTGRYKFIVTIDDNDNQAFYISNSNQGIKNNRYNSLVMKRKMLLSQRQQQI